MRVLDGHVVVSATPLLVEEGEDTCRRLDAEAVELAVEGAGHISQVVAGTHGEHFAAQAIGGALAQELLVLFLHGAVRLFEGGGAAADAVFQFLRELAQLAHHALETRRHAVERIGEGAGLVMGADADLLVEVAAGNSLGAFGGLADRGRDPADDERDQDQGEQHGGEGDGQIEGAGALSRGCELRWSAERYDGPAVLLVIGEAGEPLLASLGVARRARTPAHRVLVDRGQPG